MVLRLKAVELFVFEDALIGIRDIFLKHPAQLKMHRLSVIEKLRERMSDEDKIVRETLYQLLKAVIFPACKEVGVCVCVI